MRNEHARRALSHDLGRPISREEFNSALTRTGIGRYHGPHRTWVAQRGAITAGYATNEPSINRHGSRIRRYTGDDQYHLNITEAGYQRLIDALSPVTHYCYPDELYRYRANLIKGETVKMYNSFYDDWVTISMDDTGRIFSHNR